MSNKTILLIGAAALLLLAVTVTGPKLYKMAQIRGFVPGAEVVQKQITDKWHQTSAEHHKGRNVYWISWGNKSIKEKGAHRVNLEHDTWKQYHIGQKLELAYIGKDSKPYLADGIYASNDNLIFDCVLLLIELFGAITLMLAYRKQRLGLTQKQAS